jgi:ATP-dependent helicase Lhr and Lhr-like helicase
MSKSPSSPLKTFRPYVARWFQETFKTPSPIQRIAWPTIHRGDNALLFAPTGSGKTLAAFLCAIDHLCRKGEQEELTDAIHVLYITPLKALGNDIQRNLVDPLAGISVAAGDALPEIRTAVRTGDTPQSERARMVRKPPHILITTPESLYILLGSPRMAAHLRSVRTVIVDEVHALCDNKRGVHLSISLERLEEHVDGPLQRIGCSATLSPLEEIAGFLVGFDAQGQRRPCSILDAGMRKEMDVQVVAPLRDFLEASNTALWSSAYEQLLDTIAAHTSTLIFTNSRYKTERTALRLSELAAADTRIGSHHGSMSKEMRLEAETALKAGQLDALVATSSLELGIDIGAVDLVCQLESPKSVAAGLQRVGRAGHLLDATSKGRLLIFERDELFEAAAICRAMINGQIDDVQIPRNCLDVLAQQITGAVASRSYQADELYALIRRAHPYAALPRQQFDAVLSMTAGDHPFQMARPPRPLLLWDRAAGRLSPTRSSSHISAMCVGTIPENAEYEVSVASTGKKVGSVHNEFVDDCLRPGDVFALGSSSWRMVGVQRNRLLVEEAPGENPTVPWWLGPIASRTAHVGIRVGELRRQIASRLANPDLPEWLQREYYLCPNAAAALIDYVREQQTAVGLVPDERTLLVESWKDELGRLNIILHSPFGSRINHTWGIAVTAAAKATFDQDWSVTAANDLLLLTRRKTDAPPLRQPTANDLFGAIDAATLEDHIAAGSRDVASFGSSFRDAAVCAFQILRAWQGRRVPSWLQHHRAAELYEAAGNALEYPVIQEIQRAYLHESLDAPGLTALLRQIEAGDVQLIFKNVEAPSPFAHSFLIQERYTGDHQMGRDRRAHLLRLHRQILQEVLSEKQLAELLDPRAIDRLEARLQHRSEVSRVRTSDELAQAIRDLGDLPATAEALTPLTDGDPLDLLRPLIADHRIVALSLPEVEPEAIRLVSADLWRQYRDAFYPPTARVPVLLPHIEESAITFASGSATKTIPAPWRKKTDPQETRSAVVERYLSCRGPVTQYELMNHTGWPIGAVEQILDRLVQKGGVVQGIYTSQKPAPQWVDRSNLEEIHRLTMGYLKRELAACAPYELVDFVTRWQHLHPDTRLSGLDGLRTVIRQLQGVEVVQGVLEAEVLPGRVTNYRPEMLDQLIDAGEICWRRVSTRSINRGKFTLCFRRDMEWLGRGAPLGFDAEEKADVDIASSIIQVRRFFQTEKTAFFDDILDATDLEEGIAMRAVWHLAWCGDLYCDTYECLRHAGFEATLSACYDLANKPERILSGRDSHERVVARMKKRRLDPRLGRWSATERLVPPRQPLPDVDILRRWTRLLLDRWGIISRDILDCEVAAPPWTDLVREFKRLELLGQISRGFFIEDHRGEQYGLPEAIELLRDCRGRRSEGRELGYLPDEPTFPITFHDPANLYSRCLYMIDEAGSRLERSRSLGFRFARMVVQAGQPLVLAEGTQLVALTRAQLTSCIRHLQHNYAGREAPTQFRAWNTYPIDAHPAGSVLHDLGFRLSKNSMIWPSPRKTDPFVPLSLDTREFSPYFSDSLSIPLGPDWAAARGPEPIRPLLQKVYRFIEKELSRPRWEIHWQHTWPQATHCGISCLRIVIRQTYIEATINAPGVTDFKKSCSDRDCGHLKSLDEMDDAYRQEFRHRRDCAESSIDRYLKKRDS